MLKKSSTPVRPTWLDETVDQVRLHNHAFRSPTSDSLPELIEVLRHAQSARMLALQIFKGTPHSSLIVDELDTLISVFSKTLNTKEEGTCLREALGRESKTPVQHVRLLARNGKYNLNGLFCISTADEQYGQMNQLMDTAQVDDQTRIASTMEFGIHQMRVGRIIGHQKEVLPAAALERWQAAEEILLSNIEFAISTGQTQFLDRHETLLQQVQQRELRPLIQINNAMVRSMVEKTLGRKLPVQ